MSVSMVDTEGKSFENPGYETGEQPAATGMVKATSAPGGTDKVSKQKSLILLVSPLGWWLHIYHMLHGNSFR